MNGKLFTIFSWEVTEKMKRKAFWFSTIFIPLFIFVISTVPFLNTSNPPERPVIIGFTDSSSHFTPYLIDEVNILRQKAKNEIILMNTGTTGKNIKTLLSQKDIDVGLTINKKATTFEIVFSKSIFRASAVTLKNIVSNAFLREKVDSVNLPAQLKAELLSSPKIAVKQLKDDTNTKFLKKFEGAFAVILIFISSVLFAGGMFIRGIAEEKSNRIIELLLTSCETKTILLGKTFGLITVNIVQLLIWAFVGALFFPTQISVVLTLPYFFQLVILFAVGYLMFTLLFVSIGAFVKSDSDAQQLLAVISIVVILPVIVVLHIFGQPYDLLTQFLLYFPLTSVPTAMLKLSFQSLGNVEFLLTIIVDLFTFLILLLVSSKYFRKRVIEYGTPSK